MKWFSEHKKNTDRSFHIYFSQEDRQNASRPKDYNRRASEERASLIVADPHTLNLHLSHSFGLHNGPIIQRTGDSSPIMEDPEKPGSYTTDPELQRIGACYILDSHRESDLRDITYKFLGNYILLGAVQSPEDAACRMRALWPADMAETLLPAPTPFDGGNFGPNIISLKNEIFKNQPPDAEERYQEAVASIRSIFDHYVIDYINPSTQPPHNFLDFFGNLRDLPAFKEAVRVNAEKYLRLLVVLLTIPSHESQARKIATLPGEGHEEIVFMQGCGDLTMNEWNVAFIATESYKGRDISEWELLHAPGEPLNDRRYSCLIKWKCTRSTQELLEVAKHTPVVYPYQIAELEFKAPSLEVGPPDRHVFLKGRPIGHLIEFAVYGQQIYKDGQPVRPEAYIREFSDLRHIFKLPSLNRDENYGKETRERGIPEYAAMPRSLFNQSTRDHVWLGEAALIQGDRNLRVAALNQPIQLDLRMLGAPKEWIDVVLKREREVFKTYTEVLEGEVLYPGQWRWIREGRRTWLEIFLLRNEYPCTMIGTRAAYEGRDQEAELWKRDIFDCSEISLLAHGHNYDWQGCTIEEAASYLHAVGGAWNILLIDEGNDVFQLIRNTQSGKLESTLRTQEDIHRGERLAGLKRSEIRCVFWATETKGNHDDDENREPGKSTGESSG